MAKGGRDLKVHFDKIIDSVQSGLSSLQQVVQQQQVSSSYPSTLELQETIKSGWLKKLSGMLKSWHRKWFVIKGDCMYYYLNDFDVRPQGVVFLPGSCIIEHVFRANDPEKFVFDIIPQVCKDSARTSNHDLVSLSAQSEEERTEWIRVIRHILYGSIGGAIFGKPLEEILRFEILKDSSREVPEIVESCVEYILENGLYEEGIFRITGRSSVIKNYCDAFDRGERPNMKDDDCMDVHSASSILKLYLRELPSPLIPFDLYENITRIVMRELPVDICRAMESLKTTLKKLSVPNRNLLRHLCKFLNTIGQQHQRNKMTFSNLATIFCTAFLRPDIEKDACLLMATANSRKAVTHVLIEHQQWLFDDDKKPFSSPVNVEDLLGFSGACTRDITANRSKDLFEIRTHSLPSRNKELSLEESNHETVIMRRNAPSGENHGKLRMKQNHRNLFRVLGDKEDKKNLYWRWSISEKEGTLYEDKGSGEFDGRHHEIHKSTSSCLVQSFVGNKEYAFQSPEDIVSERIKVIKETERSSITNPLFIEFIKTLAPFDCTSPQLLTENDIIINESLLKSFKDIDVDGFSKKELQHVVNVLLNHIHKQNIIISNLNEKLK